MLESKEELKRFLKYEKTLYLSRMGGGKYQAILRCLKSHPDYYCWMYVRRLRKTGYYYANRKKNIFYAVAYIISCRMKNKLGRKLGIEMNERSCDIGLSIEHTQGIVINGLAQIGKNLILHGNNCIGVDGIRDGVPVIGDNVRLGVGAKIIGNVRIANNVTIAAGAVVVKSCEEEYAVLAGVPARIVKYNKPTQ